MDEPSVIETTPCQWTGYSDGSATWCDACGARWTSEQPPCPRADERVRWVEVYEVTE